MFDYKVTPVISVNIYNNRQKQESQDTEQKNFEKPNDFKRFLKNAKDKVSIEEINIISTIEATRKEVKYMACNHNPNDENTTLEKLNKRVMVSPTIFWYSCKECHRGFKFININGNLEEQT